MNIQELFNLKEKVAIVTGGTGHLGSAISEALAEAGALVYATSSTEKKYKNVSSYFAPQFKGKIKGIQLDILSLDSIKNCFSQIVEDSGRVDILINNASHLPVGKFHDITDEDWKNGIDGTINGVFRCTKEVTPIMEKNQEGSIINIASMYGEVSPDPSIYQGSGYDSPPHYGAGKAAIIQFTRYAAIHLAKKGIRVNAISPGSFPKPEVQQNSDFINNLKNKVPLGRVGNPVELKGAIVFLASKASSYVTGENLHVDGGWTRW